jgi:hemerythrin
MKIKFIWKDVYSVGNEEIDHQHMQMFELANGISENIDSKEIHKIIMILYKHIMNHFSSEEEHMKKIGYPKLDEHRELHNDLINNLNDLSKKLSKVSQPVFQLKKFVYDWMIDHIMNHDNQYFEFSRNKTK